MLRWTFPGVLIVVLLACGTPSATQPQVAPTATPAKASLVIETAGLSRAFGTFSTEMPWQIYPGIPRSTDVAYFEIYQGGEKANEVGNISVIRYSSAADVESARQAILKEMTVFGKANTVANLGEQALSSAPTKDWPNADVLFVRCSTVIHITIPMSVDRVVEYAKGIDKQLTC
jgi:hypothetical protein